MTEPVDLSAGSPPVPAAGGAVLRNAGALAAARAVTLVSGLIVTAWLGRMLGPANYGIIGFAAAIVAYFGFVVALGLETLGARDIARFGARTRAIASHIATLRLALAVLAIAGLAVFVAAIDKPPLVKLVIGIHGALLVAWALNMDFVYQGRAKMGVIAVREVAVSLLALAGVVLVVRDPSDVVAAAAILAGAVAAGSALLFARCRRDYSAPVFRFDARIWKLLVRIALPIAAVGMMVSFYRHLDTVMLGFMRTTAEVGLYTAAFKFFTTGLAPAMILLAAFTPALASAWGRPAEVRRTMDDFAGAAAALSAPIVATGIALAPELVTLLFGQAYLPATTAVRLLMVALWLASLHVAYAHPLLLWGHQKSALLPLACGTALNAALNVALIPRFGIEGAAFATVAAEAVLVLWFAVLQRRLGGSLSLRGAAAHLLAAGVAGALGRMAADAVGGSSVGPLATMAVGAIVLLGVYGVLVAPLWWRRAFPHRE